jgi:hypothetical protein
VGVLSFLTGILRADQTRWKALVFCLCAAVLFWLLSALNKEHTAEVALPIRVSYDPSRFVAVRPLPEKVRVNVTGNGWDLLIKSLGYDTEPVVIQLDRPDATPYILATSVRGDFANAAGKLNINFFMSDTIRIAVDDLVTRKFKLMVNTEGLKFSEDFGLYEDIKLEPDSVLVSGPEILMDSLPDAITLIPFRRSISENMTIELPVLLGAGLIAQPSRVIAQIYAGPVVVRTLQIPLTFEKVKKGRKGIEDSIRITFRGPEEILKTGPRAGWHAKVPANSSASSDFVLPEISGVPEWLTIMHVDSVRVK